MAPLSKKTSSNGGPHIDTVAPPSALPGGEVRISGHSLGPKDFRRPRVEFNDVEGSVVVSSDEFVVARVPQSAASGPIVVSSNGSRSNPHEVNVAVPIADNLHPVTSPALDSDGNIYVTFSGSRGQKSPVAVYKIDTNYNVKPFVADMMNATGIAFDRGGEMYVSSRFEGSVYRVAKNGSLTTYAESMGVATGIAFDRSGNLFVGDRSGTIFKIAPDRQIFVFATLEPSVAAYHLTIGPHGDLFVSGPTTSSFDSVYKIDPQGKVSTFYRGLGRPQGLAADAEGNLYVAASFAGQRGIVKITPDGNASLEVAGSGLVGLAFAPGRSVVLATTSAVFHLTWDIPGMLPLAEG